MIDNELSFNRHIDVMSNKATNLLNLCHRNLHMCSNKVKDLAYNMIVRLEYASTCCNPYTKRNIDKREAVQRWSARVVLSFYDCPPTADLSGNIQKSLQWDTLQHRRAVADLCMFHKLRSNLDNFAIPPMLAPSVKYNCHYNHIQYLHSDACKYQLFVRGVRIWNIIPHHLVAKPSLESFLSAAFKSNFFPYSGTNIQAQILVLGSKFCLFCCYLLFVVLQFFYLFDICLHVY